MVHNPSLYLKKTTEIYRCRNEETNQSTVSVWKSTCFIIAIAVTQFIYSFITRPSYISLVYWHNRQSPWLNGDMTEWWLDNIQWTYFIYMAVLEKWQTFCLILWWYCMVEKQNNWCLLITDTPQMKHNWGLRHFIFLSFKISTLIV